MADMHMPGVLSYDCSWTSGAQEICNRAIARHGGWTAWNQLDSIRMSPLSLSGLLPYLKGYQKTFTLPTCFEVFPRTYRVVFYGFPQAGEIAEFSRGDLRIIGSNQGVVNTIKQARTKYRGLAKVRFWRPMDCLYFFGYAWTTYLSCPFVFPTFKLLRSFAHQERGERWDALVVEIPAELDAHCRQQTFYFDQSGLLRRNDYIAEIIGRWAMAAHYSQEYALVKNIQIALRRRVYVRIGSRSLPIITLAADLEAF
jgi:hypothetical protein